MSIQPQILEFKIKSKKECEFCNSKKNIEVDHIMWFEKLYNDFITINEGTRELIFLDVITSYKKYYFGIN